MIFKSQEEANAACNARCQEALKNFYAARRCKGENIDPTTQSHAFNYFVAGFMHGVEFVISEVLNVKLPPPPKT